MPEFWLCLRDAFEDGGVPDDSEPLSPLDYADQTTSTLSRMLRSELKLESGGRPSSLGRRPFADRHKHIYKRTARRVIKGNRSYWGDAPELPGVIDWFELEWRRANSI